MPKKYWLSFVFSPFYRNFALSFAEVPRLGGSTRYTGNVVFGNVAFSSYASSRLRDNACFFSRQDGQDRRKLVLY